MEKIKILVTVCSQKSISRFHPYPISTLFLFWLYWNKNKKPPSQKNFHKNKNQKKPPIKLKKTKIWRRGWDSNPRGAKAPLALKASAVYRKRKQRKEQNAYFTNLSTLLPRPFENCLQKPLRALLKALIL